MTKTYPMRKVSLLLITICVFQSVVIAEQCAVLSITCEKSLLDSLIKQAVFASEDHQDIYILTLQGTVYRSQDWGRSFIRQSHLIPGVDDATYSYSGSTGITNIIGSTYPHLVYLQGTGFAFWSTRGDGVYKLYETGSNVNGTMSGNLLSKLVPHPTDPNYLLRTIYSEACLHPGLNNCTILAEVNPYQGYELAWTQINNYTYDISWGGLEGQLFFTTIPPEHQVPNYQLASSFNMELVIAMEYGQDTSKHTPPGFMSFLYEDEVLYVAGIYPGSNAFSMFVSLDYGATFHQLSFFHQNGTALPTVSQIFILDSSQDVSFIAVLTSVTPSTTFYFSDLFQGDLADPQYHASVPNMRITRHTSYRVDFYQTFDLPGVFIVNQYDLNSGLLLEESIRTLITFDKGGVWTPIAYHSGQNLHLFLSGDAPTYQGPVSHNWAAGILLALGNEGSYRQNASESIGLYLSRGGGYNFEKILNGNYRFEMAGHGSVFLAVPAGVYTNEFHYSWNQGLTWSTCQFSSLMTALFTSVRNIGATPAELKFLVIGSNEAGEGLSVMLDFAPAAPRNCTGADRAGQIGSDFELFQPQVSDFCLMGQGASVVRRRRGALCANVEPEETLSDVYSCPCSRLDYECDGECFQPMQQNQNLVCVNICSDDPSKDPTLPPEDCQGQYSMTQGYRLIPGDQCQGGVDLNPILVDCPGSEPSETPTPSAPPSRPPSRSGSATASVTSAPSITSSRTPSAASTPSNTGTATRTPTSTSSASVPASRSSSPSGTPARSQSPNQSLLYIIDEFTTGYQHLSISVSSEFHDFPITQFGFANGDMTGGERDMKLEVFFSEQPGNVTSTVNIFEGKVDVVASMESVCVLTIQYDGPDEGTALAMQGLGGFDLSLYDQATALMFRFDADQIGDFDFTIWDMNGASAVHNQNLVAGPQDIFVPFSAFSSIDFSRVGSMSLSIFSNLGGTIRLQGISVWGYPVPSASRSASPSLLISPIVGDVLVIDPFTPQQIISLNVHYLLGALPRFDDDLSNDPTVLGTERDAILILDNSLNPVDLSMFISAGRWKTVFPSTQQPDQFSAQAVLQYDGLDQSTDVNLNGLNSFDLTSNGRANSFHLRLLSAAGCTVSLTVYQQQVSHDVDIVIVPSDSPSDYYVNFAQFDADLTDVGAVQIAVSANHGDVTFETFATAYYPSFPSVSATPSLSRSGATSRSSTKSYSATQTATRATNPQSPSVSSSLAPEASLTATPAPAQSESPVTEASQSSTPSAATSRTATPSKSQLYSNGRPSQLPVSDNTEPEDDGSSWTSVIIVLAAVAGLILLVVIVGVGGYLFTKYRKNRTPSGQDVYGMLASPYDNDL